LKLIYKSLLTKENIDHCLSFTHDEGERKELLILLSKLDIRLSNPYKVGHDFEYKIWIIQNFSKKRVYILENHFETFPKIVDLTLADVMEILRDILNVPDSFEEYCDTVVGADEDNPVDRSDYEDYRKSADRLSKVLTKKEITSIPVLKVLPEPVFINKQDEKNKDLIHEVREHTLRRAQKRGAAIIHVDNVQDYNRLQDYLKSIRYREKLMKQYGYDEMTEEFNYKLFPVPKEDRELAGIRKDIDDFFKLLGEYNDYLRYLAQKYAPNIGKEELCNKGVVILHEPELSNKSVNELPKPSVNF
jgi:hypothetical protein